MYFVNYFITMIKNFLVIKSQYVKTKFLQSSASFLISKLHFRKLMMIAVHFDNQAFL